MLKHSYAVTGLLAAFLLAAAPLSRALPETGAEPGWRLMEAPSPSPAEPDMAERAAYRERPALPYRSGLLSHVAMGAKVSSLGVGIILARPLAGRFDVSGAVDFFHYNTGSLITDGMHYQGHVSLTSAEAHLDWYPWRRSFHISPGALVYTNNHAWATGSVPGGDTFSLNNANYMSSPTDPVHGDAQVAFRHFAPMLTVGWGNPIPRSGRRWSIPFEMGFAYVGDPTTSLNIAGTVCDSAGRNCEPVTQFPGFQSNLDAERQNLQKHANVVRILPVISIGYMYRF
jgi:hypothetical protein